MRSPTTNPEKGLRTAKSYEKAIQGWPGPARHNAPGGGESINERNSLGENYRNFKPTDLFTRSLWGLPLESGGETGAEARGPRGGARLGQGGTEAAAGLPRSLRRVPGRYPAKVRSGGLLGGAPAPSPPAPRRAVGVFFPTQFPHSLIFTRFHLPIKLPQIAKSLICMQGTPFKDANLLSPLRT